VSFQERSKLMRQWNAHDVPSAAVITKCAAGLVIVLGIALMGVYSPDPSASSQIAA
jgi:hypothetical protein